MGTAVNTIGLGYQNPSSNQVPQEGPIAVPYLLDFTGAVTEYDFDFTLPVQTNKISQINTLYVDASSMTDDVTIFIEQIGQTIVAKAGTQGYYPVLAPNPPRFQITNPGSDHVCPIFFINVPLSGVVWSAT